MYLLLTHCDKGQTKNQDIEKQHHRLFSNRPDTQEFHKLHLFSEESLKSQGGLKNKLAVDNNFFFYFSVMFQPKYRSLEEIKKKKWMGQFC